MKWCTGPCGRELPISEFCLNLRGNPQGKCRACHRVSERERYRKKYHHKSPEFRNHERARKRAEYHREAA
jgi:hypothetical protein